MKKNWFLSEYRYLFACFGKILKIMRFTIFLVVLTCLQVFAVNNYAQTKKLELKVENETIAEVLNKIEDASDFFFFYNNKAVSLDKVVSIDVKDKTITEVLDALFEGTNVKYSINNRQIILSGKEGFTQQKQDREVSGKVTDGSGLPLPGVTVLVKGTIQGTVTNVDGTFSLSHVSEDATLVFSFVGMKMQEVGVKGKTSVNVIMTEDAIGIQEVVAVGYGVQKKLNLTGSVASMEGDELAKKPVTQTSMALQGMTAGVTVTQKSGEPGQDGGTIRIRGIGTMGDSNPLILVDGISSDINFVDPNDIETISVLKDAASAAIYGSRAANGVIIITTKRAKNSNFSINYSNYVGWQEPTNMQDIVSGYDHMVMINLANKNVNKPEPFSQEYIENYAKHAPSDEYPETNWHNVMLKNKALQQNHHLSINGGGEKVSFRGSVSYLKQDGITINNGYERVNARFNTDVRLKDNLQFGFDISLRADDDATAGSPWYFLNRYPRNLAGKNANGTWGIGWDGTNTWATLEDGGLYHQKDYDVIAKINADWQPVEGLNLNFMYAPDLGLIHSKDFSKHVDLFYPDGSIYNASPYKASLAERYEKNLSDNLRLMASYTKSFSDHSINFIGGFEQLSYRYDWMRGYRDEYLMENYEVLNAGPSTNQQATGSAVENSLRSFFGRVNYDYKQKYLFEANLRYDGSSRFAPGHRYGVFPSFSAGWRITEENFMSELQWLDNLKLRASWGQLGNQNIGDYPSSSVVTLGQDYVFNNNTAAQGGAITDANNQDISWETAEMVNMGLDVSVWSKVSFSIEYYIKDTKDILLKLPIPMTMGLNPAYQNAGKVRNTGWDYTLSFNDKVGDLEYRIGVNLSDVKNEIIDLVGTGPYIEAPYIKKEGYSIYSLYGLESAGLFQNTDEIAAHATQYGNVQPGDIKYVDQLTVDTNGDGIPDAGDGKIDADDRVVMGNYFPRYSYGIDLYAKYKNFDFSALVQGVGKVDGYLSEQGVWAFYVGGTAREWQKDYWTQDNPDASYPRLTFNWPNNEQPSTYWVKSAAYLRLKNLQIGYTIPKKIIAKTGLNHCRVFFSGQNLLTLDDFYDGFDPEAPIGTGAYYPMVKVYSFGVSVNL